MNREAEQQCRASLKRSEAYFSSLLTDIKVGVDPSITMHDSWCSEYSIFVILLFSLMIIIIIRISWKN